VTRPSAHLLMAVDPDKPFNTPENIEKERTKLLDEIKDVLKTQGVERPNPDELEHLVEIRVWNGASAVRDALAAFDGGRVVVGVTSTPFKCPPAPSEVALLMHDYLTDRGQRDRSEISLVTPLGAPIPPSPGASKALLAAFAERDIRLYPSQLVRELDPARQVARLADGGEIPYDLFIGVPVHQAPAVVQASGLCADGWIPVNPHTLETVFPGVYAIGDVTSVGTPKAGVFAEGQAAVVAAAIIARQAGRESPMQYDGRGQVYMEFGHCQVARLDLTFAAGRPPTGTFEAPSTDLTGHKSEFVATRIQRWLGRDVRHPQ
jgi:sulfide:quinone oxidoreductase